MFKTIFFWAQKSFWGTKNLGALLPNALLATGLPVKQNFRTWMKILLRYIFG